MDAAVALAAHDRLVGEGAACITTGIALALSLDATIALATFLRLRPLLPRTVGEARLDEALSYHIGAV